MAPRWILKAAKVLFRCFLFITFTSLITIKLIQHYHDETAVSFFNDESMNATVPSLLLLIDEEMDEMKVIDIKQIITNAHMEIYPQHMRDKGIKNNISSNAWQQLFHIKTSQSKMIPAFVWEPDDIFAKVSPPNRIRVLYGSCQIIQLFYFSFFFSLTYGTIPQEIPEFSLHFWRKEKQSWNINLTQNCSLNLELDLEKISI